MGGKSKQSQRVKNNARPSNSSRAAELLGSNVPSFVGFAAHPDLGIIPVAPGLSTAELLPEVFDSSISGDYQLLLKKLGKKDPITKAKALQEFTDRISKSEVDEVKAILPLWPKYYQSLGNDINHKVRELTQSTQAAIANKVGKAMAPYLKQLAPVWISSQFDNYAPVASAATTTFKSSFSSNKVQEVFVFCQNEIMDYIWKNLTFHSASTLSNTKSYSAEDAENKYQRVILCSLRSLALFLEQIDGKSTLEVKEKLSNLIQNQKYWSFSKHKVPNIKAAWFEALYSYLQNAPELAEANRNQVIQITFQNMDSTDPLVSPYVWGCILLIQTVFENWYDSVNFQKVLQPKLNYLLKTGGSTCASIIYPNLLPFLSKFTDKTLSHCSLQDFYNNFFNNFKESLTHNLNSAISKSDASAIVSAFYECLRYVIQAQAPDFKTNDDLKWNFCKSIVNDHVVDVVKWNIVKENITTKYVFTNVSSLIAYWSMNSSNFDLYFHLLETFWAQILKLIVENEELEENVESYVKQFVEFIQTLHNASSSTPGENKVKFSDEVKAVARAQKSRNTTSVLHKDLRQIATKLSKLLLERMSKEKSTTYIVQLKTLADLFEDSEFYAEISNGSSLQSAANNIFDILQGPEQISETTVDILFQILMLLENAERNKYLNKLLKLPNKKIQQWVLHRLLSYPLCVEPEVREILSQDHVTDLILNIAYEVITEKSTDKFNLLHKCFFQIDSGEILINKKTVEGITRIMSKPLVSDSMEEMIDTCGSFIAQIMPVICSNNSTRSLQSDIFIKLFKFSINRTESDYLSEDTLWEVTTCWQDALSSNDITMNDELFLECCEIIDNRVVNSQDITVPDIYNIADMVAKLILCSTENEENEAERYKQIDSMITKLENSPLYLRYFEESKTLCTYFELIKGQRTIDSFNGDHIPELTTAKLLAFFRKQMLNFSVLFKLTFNVKTEKHVALNTEGEDDQENTEDYFDSSENLLKTWSDVIYYNILKGINVVAIGESLKLNSHVINSSIWDIISKLLEKTLFVLKNASDDVAAVIKDKLFQLVISNVEKDISWCRAVPYLNSLNQYGKDGNGFILLYEDSINAALDKNNYLAYVNITHSMLDKLEPKCLPINYQMLEDHVDLVFKETSLRLLLSNHFTGDYSNMSDQRLIAQSLDLITEVSARQQSCSEFLLYRQAIDETEFDKLATVVEFINFLNEVLKHFPTELNLKHWDLVRLSLSSWVLSLSNSVTKFNNPQVAMFIASVFRLHSTLVKFITEEKTKSSTELLTNVIDEWDNLFSKEVNLVLFKSFHYMISNCAKSCLPQLLEEICQYAEQLDYKLILNACDSGFKISIDDVINVALDNLSSELHEIRVICVYIINEVAKYVIPKNMEKLEKQVELVDQTGSSGNEKDEWHFLHKFCKHLEKYELNVKQYVEEFSYKLTELTDLQPIQRSDALPYLFLWNGIIHACSKAPAELRSQYALWITENKYEHIYLNFLFRAMPVEILKNHDSKVMNNDMFKPIPWPQFKGHSTTVERYACYFYMQTLKYLPAVVRKWWNTTHTRQKTFVDKLTTNFVSNLICHDELRAITSKKEKHENMQVTVHTSTREVAAVYSIDEARMELVITLAPNHPLGAVKVETGKQIGGRAQSRNVGMQLTIFLTHQNGSIFDGLSLWKKNLDKKFEGVEECYVCYTVIHQDTCQLPKLSCRTCKKKFHGPCLYKWFTTSSKSTCPICRNVF